MNELNNLPEELPKDTLNWLRTYGYTLNSDDERYQKIKSKLKELYPYEYYFYIDEDIRNEAEKIFEYEERTKEFYKTWKKRFSHEKKRLIKELYGLEKKGIR